MSKKKRKSKAPKTRNSGTFTDAQFFNWLRQKLRRISITWKPINEVRKKAKIPYTGNNKRRKVSYVCSVCKGEFSAKEVSVDHTIPIGSLQKFEDLPSFVEKLFCEEDGLSLMCKKCHDAKTILDNQKTRENE
jgi:5-methylcytosine-specific restriction endonuclease McrA